MASLAGLLSFYFMLSRLLLLAFPALVLSAPGCGGNSAYVEDYKDLAVILPRGQQIRAQVVTDARDMMHGMMFRDSLAPDRGMLFVHAKPGRYHYWMYQVRIPLDIIWMSANRRIVEISADTPPCRTVASQCPQYGGNVDSKYVLELAGGMAAKYGLQVGDTLTF